MQFYISHGLGWLYELFVILGITGFGGLSVFLIFKNGKLEDRIKKMKAKEELYKKEIAQYETVSEEFYEKVWAE